MIPENCPTCEGVGKVKTKKEIDAEEKFRVSESRSSGRYQNLIPDGSDWVNP